MPMNLSRVRSRQLPVRSRSSRRDDALISSLNPGGSCRASQALPPARFRDPLMSGNRFVRGRDHRDTILAPWMSVGPERIDGQGGAVTGSQNGERAGRLPVRKEPKLEAHRLSLHQGRYMFHLGDRSFTRQLWER